MAIDSLIIETFELYKGSKYLPDDQKQLDLLVRYTVRNLGNKPKQAKKILRDINPEKSANYLVGALADPECRDYAIGLLKFYGASNITVNPLVGALANPECKDSAIKLLKFYKATDITVGPLVGALADAERRDAATQVLLHFGKKCLKYIKKPRPRSPLYIPLTDIIKSIKMSTPTNKKY